MSPAQLKLTLVLGLLLTAFFSGCYWGALDPRQQLAALQAVAAAKDAEFRKLEEEVKDAQEGYVKAWTAARDADRANWVRRKASLGGRVSTVCSEPGSSTAGPQEGLEGTSGSSNRDLLPSLIDALEVGEKLEQTLVLCQQELKQCEAMRR